MYIEQVKIELSTEYTIQNDDKRKKPKKHIDSIGTVKIDYPMSLDKAEKLVDAILDACEHDHVLADVSIKTSNL
jgi:hypothetical protein|tara:strand:+ start:547 stop:768 length:222 start_codon:yes stop_codon:yes gene_type:complete